MRTLKHGVRTHEFSGLVYDHFRTTGSGRKVHLFSRTYVDQVDEKTGAIVKTAAQLRDADIAALAKAGAEEKTS